MLPYKQGSWRFEFAAEQETAYKSYCTVPKGVRRHDREWQRVEASGASGSTCMGVDRRVSQHTPRPPGHALTLLVSHGPLLPRST